jgi:hypothetical protein
MNKFTPEHIVKVLNDRRNEIFYGEIEYGKTRWMSYGNVLEVILDKDALCKELVKERDQALIAHNESVVTFTREIDRKASDVAMEIFAEIEEGIEAAISTLQFDNNPIHRQVKHETYLSLMRFIKTIEKKYTKSEGADDD